MQTVTAAALEPKTDGYRFGANSLTISRELSQAEYESVGRRIGSIANGVNWAVGDWIVYGEAGGYAGAKYTRAQELTGMTFDVLSQASRVAEAYEASTRVKGVSWTHHRSALGLPTGERVKALQRAAAEGWTAVMLGVFIAERQRAMSAGIPFSKVPSPERDVPHGRAKIATWRTSGTRRRVFRECPKCGHRWDIQTTHGVVIGRESQDR